MVLGVIQKYFSWLIRKGMVEYEKLDGQTLRNLPDYLLLV